MSRDMWSWWQRPNSHMFPNHSTISNKEILLKNLHEMFPWFYMYSDLCNRFKSWTAPEKIIYFPYLAVRRHLWAVLDGATGRNCFTVLERNCHSNVHAIICSSLANIKFIGITKNTFIGITWFLYNSIVP